MTPVSITDRTGVPLGAAASAGPQHPLAAANQLLAGETVHQFIAESGAATLLAASAVAGARGPSTGPTPEALGARIDAVDLSAPLGGTNAALTEAADLYLKDAVYFHHPRYQAHLNCPVLIPAVAAEALVTSVNSSMDTWDQSAGATLIERRLTRWTADLIGLGTDADGIFTSGGTQSNLQAMLIARNHAVASRTGSLPERLAGLRIYASADSHFSISKAATLLGMGEDAVVSVPTDSAHRMDAAALRSAVEADAAAGLTPMAIVATAGTTDFGAIDPLAACSALAGEHGAWFHVDAAYGCGLLISRHRDRLAGIEGADSVTVDYHKSFFQPIGSSALLLADGANFGHITHYSEYLNPAGQAGTVPNQVDKSLQTTRRFDALKLWVSLRSMGAEAIGALFDELIDLAATAASLVAAHPELELAAEAQLSTVVFRFVPAGHDDAAPGAAIALNALQDEIRASLYSSGEAMVAATTVDGARHLKLTLLNPRATLADLEAVLTAVVVAGARLTEEAAR
ncbi:pyridoxal phosphate-dependent decarboxylase family protein [Zhihengliuella halotolerans]|uniref:pyridoxal phosphate-dependent decarboxylase family protein n=1 Tax=Zhihengliuella halotolerans TaxID=370736 RepID=UPI000C804B16|nr:aspartate aminotransferase family protein [Zhihengliuella halotolerans]